MSRYDLEEALNNFIDERLSGYGSDEFASYDHEHDTSDFEAKVDNYLGDNFNVGGGCRVQRAFEQSVRAIVESFFDNDAHEDNLTRTLLKSIISSARKLPTDKNFHILARCETDLLLAVSEHEASQVTSPPIPLGSTEALSNSHS